MAPKSGKASLQTAKAIKFDKDSCSIIGPGYTVGEACTIVTSGDRFGLGIWVVYQFVVPGSEPCPPPPCMAPTCGSLVTWGDVRARGVRVGQSRLPAVVGVCN